MKRRAFYPEIFAISLAVILLEISYTRIFSFKSFYYFTYLIIGLSLLGLGSGGILTVISPRLRALTPSRLIPACSVAGGAAIFFGYPAIALTQLNLFYLLQETASKLGLLIVCFLLFIPFLMAGIAIATILGSNPPKINRQYFADLAGAGLGCALAIPLMELLTPPGAVVLSGLIFVLAGLRLAWSSGRAFKITIASVAIVLILGLTYRQSLPDPVPDKSKTIERTTKTLFSKWSSIFRVDVVSYGANKHLLLHDGLMGSALYRFSGDLSTLKGLDTDTLAIPFSVSRRSPRVLIIGAAGGKEILVSLYFGAAHITAVELNPVTTSLLTDRFAEFTGHLTKNERVKYVNAEGRSYLKRDTTKYDLIWFVAPDTYSAINAASSGAYVLSEAYLYTVEAILESFDHLSEAGMLCIQFGEIAYDLKPNRTSRYVATAREALRRRGISNFDQHILVATSPSLTGMSTIILKKSPYTEDEIGQFLNGVHEIKGGRARHAGGRALDDGAVNKIITMAPGALSDWYESYPYQVSPSTDDAPFFWHFARFRDSLMSNWNRLDWEDRTGETLILNLLVFVAIFSALVLFLPFLTIRRTWTAIPHKAKVMIYFAAIGIGFMLFEISLIQKLTLFLGYPTYSLSVTLFGLLVFTGLGSLASGRYGSRRNNTLLVLLACIILLALFYQLGLPRITDHFVGSALELRIGLTILMISPLGFCLGAFMPIGLGVAASLTKQPEVFIAWGWAVNGFFSVTGSILSTMLGMTMGFNVVLLTAVLIYMIGIASLRAVPSIQTRVD